MASDDVDLRGFNPFDAAVQQCPHPYYHAMRSAAPVFPVAGTNLAMVTRHDLITPILRDPATFSSAFDTGEAATGPIVERLRAAMAKGWPRVSTMLTTDPPWHTRYRATVAAYFQPKRIAELRPAIEAIVSRLVDGWIGEGSIELVERFAVPLPVEAIAHVLNVPADRMGDFKRWSDDSVATIGAMPSDERRLEAVEGIVEFQHYFAAQIEARRGEPQGDLLSDLVHATVATDDGATRALTMAEMLGIVQQLLVAGNETTTKALTEGVRLLAEHPDVWAALRSDLSQVPAFVEEVLRLSTPTQGMFRVVTQDTTIDGVPVPKGTRVVLVYAAANRDPAVWGQDADELRIDRPNLKDSLAFGKGIHFCLGAPLSRLELAIAFEHLCKRLQNIELLPTNTFDYHPSFVLRGLKHLDVGFTAADRPQSQEAPPT